jgi:uncharacterized membrane protein
MSAKRESHPGGTPGRAKREPTALVSRVLRGGLWVSGVLLTAGAVVHLAVGGGAGRFGRVVLKGGDGPAAALLWWGLTALVLTPIVRIVVTVGVYSRSRIKEHRRFAALAGCCLLIILAGVWLGRAPG